MTRYHGDDRGVGSDAGRAVPDGLSSPTEPVSRLGPPGFDPSRGVWISRELYAFLMGEGPLEGVWFGDLNEGLPGAFWWRGLLRCAAGWPDDAIVQEDQMMEPDTWIVVGNGFSACISEADNGTWEVWVRGPSCEPFRSAWNLSRDEAADNLTGVVTNTYGDEGFCTPGPEMPGAGE